MSCQWRGLQWDTSGSLWALENNELFPFLPLICSIRYPWQVQRDKQSPLELIKYTGHIHKSFGRMGVRGGSHSGITTLVYVWGLVLVTTFSGNIYFLEWAGRKGVQGVVCVCDNVQSWGKAAGGSACRKIKKNFGGNQNMSGLFKSSLTSLSSCPLRIKCGTTGMASRVDFLRVFIFFVRTCWFTEVGTLS